MTAIEEQILDCFPSGSYALSALLRLMDIVETDEVTTAAVECKIQPRLLINATFVKKYADTPEKLLMLVMHELHHVLLGHTTLFKTVTPTDNFVFDCVINALISRMFPQIDYLEFLTKFYSDKKFPECLLRPPAGWNGHTIKKLPEAIQILKWNYRIEVGEIYRSLYSETGVSYKEVHDILPKLLNGGDILGIPLLGGHKKEGAIKGDFESRSPVLFETVRSIVEEWPQPPDPIHGRSLADILEQETVTARSANGNRAILRNLFRKIAAKKLAGRIRQMDEANLDIPTPVPVFDRRSVVLRSLGVEPLFYNGSISHRRRKPSSDRVHVYVDVSGSMDGIKDAVYGAVIDCREWVHPTVHLFSSVISDITHGDLKKGIVRTTGGTDIICVANHIKSNHVRRACIITDGWVGKPLGGHKTTLSKTKLGVAYVGDSINPNDLAKVADHVSTLNL
jgi:hypothetical protein